MKLLLLTLIGLLSIHIYSYSQLVETVAGPFPRINNGLALRNDGCIFASDLFGTSFNGNSIHKINPDGTSSLFANGLSQPAGLAFDPNGILFVAEFSGNEISMIDQQGTVSLFASGLNQPADLVFDSDTNLYVSNYGNGSISKITQGGSLSDFVTGLNQPVGIAIDENNTLYSANLADGIIYEIDSQGNKDSLTIIPDLPIGFMTYSSGNLYITSTGGNRIYRLDLSNNTTSIFAGSGTQGTLDGIASAAQFTNPDGIVANTSGDTLYVSENNSNLLRRIILNSVALIPLKATGPFSVSIFPNPSTNFLKLELILKTDAVLKLELFDLQGELIKTWNASFLSQGSHERILSIQALETGIYYLKFSVGNHSEIKRIIIE